MLYEGSHLRSYRLSLEVAGLSPRTIRLYLAHTERLLAHAGVDAPALRREHVTGFLAHELARGQSRTSVRIYASSVRGFCKWLHAEGYTGTDAMAGLRVPAPTPKPVRPLTDAEVRSLLSACASARDEALLRFLLDSGARLGEAVSLTAESLDLAGRTAMVAGKTGPRLVVFGRRTALVTDRLLRMEGIEHGPVWRGPKGPLNASGVQQAIYRLGREAGVRVHPHQLRHTWADRAMRQGIPDRVIMALGGWRTSDMLKRYAAVTDMDRARAAYRSWLD